MPRAKKAEKLPRQTPQLNTRLTAADLEKVEKYCREKRLTKTEFLRKAALRYLNRRDEPHEDEDRLVKVLLAIETQRRKDTERLAKMMARIMMDIGIINQVLYKRAPKEDRDKLWDSARQSASERLRRKRKGGDPEATEIVNDALSSEA